MISLFQKIDQEKKVLLYSSYYNKRALPYLEKIVTLTF